MATLPADLDAVTSLPTTVTANVTAGHTAHSEIIHKALRAIETAWASLAETGALDAEAIRDLMAAFIVGTGLVTVTHNDAGDTLTVATTATANSSDATLLARANHTGTQDPATTLTAWVEAVVDAVAPALVSGVHTNISFAYDDAAGKINATAVGGSGGGPIPASSITDSTTFGRAVLTAVDAATARAAIGAGTSSLVLGTTAGTAKAGDYIPTAASLSLGNVTNTSDANKPVSTAQQAALDLKANIADAVLDTGDQSVDGIKTFIDAPQVPDGSFTVAKVTGIAAAITAEVAAQVIPELPQSFQQLVADYDLTATGIAYQNVFAQNVVNVGEIWVVNLVGAYTSSATADLKARIASSTSMTLLGAGHWYGPILAATVHTSRFARNSVAAQFMNIQTFESGTLVPFRIDQMVVEIVAVPGAGAKQIIVQFGQNVVDAVGPTLIGAGTSCAFTRVV